MVIIMDSKDNEDVDAILPGDDGHGSLINIPVVLIRKSDGDNLLNILKKNDTANLISVKVTFKMVEKFFLGISFKNQEKNEVDYAFWMAVDGIKSYDIVEELFEV
jgi:hypothetical protein